MSAISTHVLDTARGLPAAGIAVTLERAGEAGAWAPLGQGTTDADGRIPNLVPAGGSLAAATYRLSFATGAWFAAQGVAAFYPEVRITFAVADPARHHHVPLLLSPFGYSTYRGS